MYLLLGPPGAGKSSLLKAIAGRLETDKTTTMKGTVQYNGQTLQDKSKYHIDNAVAYIEQVSDSSSSNLQVLDGILGPL